jgi:PAS domain S-box-containing protein
MFQILIVDDKPENLYLLQSLLEVNDFKIISARNGAEALGLMRTDIPDLIITDILMPVMDGFTLCKECKKDKSLKNIPFFFYTATYTDTKDEEFALSLGADRFILKPQEPDEFLKIIEDFLEEVRHKKIKPRKITEQPETVVLREYNEVLIRKIEDKMLQTEKSEKELRRYSEKLEEEILERKKNEDSLQKSQHLFQTLARVSPVGIFRTKPDGETTYVNPKWSELSGLSAEEAMGSGWIKAVHPEDMDKISGTWENDIESAKESTAEYRFLRPDGSIVWVMGKAVPELIDNEIIGYIGTITDITDRKLSEDILKSSEERLQILFDYAPDAYYINDLKGNFIDGNIAAEKLLGYKKEELIGKNFLKLNLLSFNQLAIAAKLLAKNAMGKATGPDEFVINRKDGSKITVEILTHPVRIKGQTMVMGIARDISDRKRSEEALHEREHRLSSIYQTVGDVIYHLAVEADNTYRFISANQAFFNVTGLREDMIIGKLINEVIPEPSLSMVLEKYSQAIKEKSIIRWEEVTDYPSGKLFGDVSIAPVVDDSGICTHLVGSVHDITKRKRAEEALAESEIKYRQLVSQSPDGIFIVDLSGKFLSVNASICNSLKYTEEELLSIKLLDIVPEKYHSLHKQRFLAIMNGATLTSDAEYEVIGKDGIAHFVEVLSVPYLKGKEIAGFQGIARDITERKNAEKIIRESEVKYRRIFENVQDLYYETCMEGKILEVSPSIEILSEGQYRRDDLIGKSIFDFYSEKEERAALLLQLKEKGTVSDFEITLKNRDGSKVPCSLSSKVSFDENGHPDKIIGSMRNITERKNALEKLMLAKEKAEESDRLKTAFLHNISHEIRTPMNAIVGFSALLTEPGLDEASMTSFIDTITQSSNQLLAIISDIIEISNIEAGILKSSKDEIRVNLVFQRLFDQFYPKAAENGITFKKETPLPDNKAIIQSDNTKFIQILTNLLSNAFKFTSNGTIEFGYVINDRFINFYVSDTGIGIPEDQYLRIFDRFYQVEHMMARHFEGTGLGLSISKAFVELLGGKIWVDSELGKGSVFYFTLPFNTAETHLPDTSTRLQETTFFKKASILIAEDDENNFSLIVKFLAYPNLTLIRARNGVEAVKYCESGQPVDLVLMDLKMPEMDGYEATKKIKGILPELPVIAQTAFVTDNEKIYNSGCIDIITKPFSRRSLLEKIEKYLKD